MKAALHDRYGPPEVIAIRDVPKSVPEDNEVLIRVRTEAIRYLEAGHARGRIVIATE
jgi:NADPH:quinone reductase-like Zn-dependent oxidoreductase